MKNRFSFIFAFLLLGIFGMQSLTAQKLVEDASFTEKEANFKLIAPNSFLLEIAGPNGYYFKDKLAHTNNISIANTKADGSKFADGFYQMQVTPIITLTETERAELTALRAEGNFEKINAYRLSHDLPDAVAVHNISFSIKDGAFVNPDQKEFQNVKMPTSAYTWEQDHPALYASLNTVELEFNPSAIEGHAGIIAKDNSNLSEDDQVFLDDVIIDGSLCVGQDCVNGESFGFDTERLKENNLRLHFDDTSSSASFPSNDWRITINDSSNGGASYFAISDATAGTNPLTVRAGAGNNAIYVSNSGGNVGMGTASPVVELHITDGDSPTLRLEQNGASGWTPQTWDIAGNETNFFVRDVTNGSKLPFKIKPGAPDNSIYIDADGDIGLGTANPGTNALQVENGDVYVKAGNLGVNTIPDASYAVDVVGNSRITGNLGININPRSFALNVSGSSQFTGGTFFNGDITVTTTTGSTFLGSSNYNLLRLDPVNNRIGIGTLTPAFDLQVCGTIGMTGASVSTGIACSSDIRFKKNLATLTSSLDKIMNLRGVNYNWKTSEFPERGFTDDNQIGFIAQEMELLFPELVMTNEDGYMAVDYAKITPVLVEAIKEQQTIIDAQQKEINELQALKSQVASLAQMVSELTQKEIPAKEEVIGEKK